MAGSRQCQQNAVAVEWDTAQKTHEVRVSLPEHDGWEGNGRDVGLTGAYSCRRGKLIIRLDVQL